MSKFTGKRVLRSIPVSEDLKNKRRVDTFFKGIEQAKKAFEKAPQGGKYQAFFRGINLTIAVWKAFDAEREDAEVVEGDAGPT